MAAEETLIDFNKICRLCMSEETTMCSIFSEEIGVVPLPLRIMACVSIEITATDGLPTSICNTCLQQVDVWYKFKDLCENTDTTLRKLLNSEPVDFGTITQIKKGAIEVKKYFTYSNSSNSHETGIEETENVELAKTEPKIEPSLASWTNDGPDLYVAEDGYVDLQMVERRKRKLNYTDVTYDHPLPSKDGKVHQCRVCLKYLKNVTTRNRHELERHPPPLACKLCDKTFTTVHTYNTHRMIHLGLTKYKCSFCGKHLASRSTLVDHEKVHTGERPVACTLCEKTFSSKANLKVHLKFHAGLKTYFCHICGKGHVTYGNLKLHIKRHFNERNHVCDKCGKGFNGKSELNKHIDSHNLEKKFECEYCLQKLKNSNSLRRHINIQHLKLKPHKCQVCQREFGRRENLREHMQVHALRKEFNCPTCNRQFTHARYLKKHKCE